jgi:hypothetical protein
MDAAFVELALSDIESAQHFVLPDGGRLFDDDLRGLKGTWLRLPYPSITLEYFVEENDRCDEKHSFHVAKRLIYACESDAVSRENRRVRLLELARKHGLERDIERAFEQTIYDRTTDYCIDVWAAFDTGDTWVPSVGMYTLLSSEWEGQDPAGRLVSPVNPASIAPPPNATKIRGYFRPILPQQFTFMASKHGHEFATNNAMSDLFDEVGAVLELCEALSCSNVRAETYQHADSGKNARRIRDGKLPIYETKILTVDVPNTAGKTSRGDIGERTGPREHLRRGHIRRINGGSRNIWVNSCVVGHRELGRIDKTYRVNAAL